MRYLDKLEEAEKRGYTYKEIDAYARGREKATMDKRKKEFKEFYSKPKKEVEEARTIPRKKGGGFEKKTTSPDRRVAPTEKALEGEGLSRAEYRRRMKKKLKEAYTLLGDTLAEAMLGEARVNKKIEKSTKAMGRYIRGDRRGDQTPETARGRAIKAGEDLTTGQRRAMHKEALKLKKRNEGLSEGIRSKVADKLDKFSRKQYRKGEVDDASGKPKRAGLRGRAAHAAGKLAQKVRPMKEGYQQIGHLIAEVVSKAVLSSDETVKRRLDRRRAVVKGRMEKARKDPLSPRGTNSRRGFKSDTREMEDQINTADVWRSKSYKKKYPKKKS